MEYINGEIKILYLKKNGEYLPIGCLSDNNFSETSTTLDTTVRTNKNGWSSSIPVTQSYSIEFSGLLTVDLISDTNVTFQEIRDFKRQRTLIEWKIDDGEGNPDFGQGYITSLSEAANIDELVSFSGGIIGSGEPTNTFDSIYYEYKERVEAAGGTLSSEECTKEYIEQLIQE